MRQIPMSRFRFASPLRYGCVTIDGLASAPLSEAVFADGEGKLGLTLWGDAPEPWHGDSLVSIQMFRLPEAEAEFEKDLQWFAVDKKPRARLPEGRGVALEDLAPAEVAGEWEHDFFATSGRDLFRVYRSPSLALFIRFLGRSGTMLDHPVLAGIAAGLTIDAGQWVEEIQEPEVIEGAGRLDEREPEAAQLETYRQGRPKSEGAELAEWVHENIAKGDPNVLAVAWGDALCEAAGWEWVVIENELLVAPPDRAHVIDPLDLIQTGRKNPKKDTSLLVFNMIVAGNLPPEPPFSYVVLG